MNSPCSDAAPASAEASPPAGDTPILAALALLWGQLFASLSPAWKEGTYYSYGWFVAPISAYFFWRRWKGRAPRSAPAAMDGGSPPWWKILPVLALLAGLLFFARVAFADSPGWRFPAWLHAGLVVVVHHAIIGLTADWRTSRQFFPVTFFALSAVPYPMRLEVPLVHSLAEMVTAVCRELFLLAGIPVTVTGEQLSLDGHNVAVTDGCSGLRSIQSLLMAGLFFGELYWLPAARRIVLVAIAMGTAVLTNVGRALWLAWTNFHRGEEAMNQWHDAAGHSAFALGCALLLVAAHTLQPRLARRVVRRASNEPR